MGGLGHMTRPWKHPAHQKIIDLNFQNIFLMFLKFKFLPILIYLDSAQLNVVVINIDHKYN